MRGISWRYDYELPFVCLSLNLLSSLNVECDSEKYIINYVHASLDPRSGYYITGYYNMSLTTPGTASHRYKRERHIIYIERDKIEIYSNNKTLIQNFL